LHIYQLPSVHVKLVALPFWWYRCVYRNCYNRYTYNHSWVWPTCVSSM